jgi:hypothetical protein
MKQRSLVSLGGFDRQPTLILAEAAHIRGWKDLPGSFQPGL